MQSHIEPAVRGDPNRGAWIGFLAMAFCLVGMVGMFASYAAPLPYQRELHRAAVLDQALATPADQLEGLRDALGDSADAVLTGTAPLARRVAAERSAMQVRFTAEGDAVAGQLHLLIVVVTLMAALIGGVMLGFRRKA